MVKKEPWAVFLDIDGTLIGNTPVISEYNAAMIKKARDAGHYVFIDTGRACGNIPAAFYDFISLTDGLIAGSGTYLELNGKTFFDGSFEKDVLREISEYILEHKDLWAVFECKDTIIGANSVPDEWGVKKYIHAENDFDTAYADERVEVIAVGRRTPEDFREKFGGRMRIIQMRYFADCILYGCSKSEGMRTVLKELNIPVEHSIAIGDSENDLDMLGAAGISVAVANAAPAVLQAADMITASNVDDGVGKAIEKLLFT